MVLAPKNPVEEKVRKRYFHQDAFEENLAKDTAQECHRLSVFCCLEKRGQPRGFL